MSIEPPQEGFLDKVSKLLKAGIESGIPGGAVATEVLFNFIKLPYEKRTEKWQKDVSDALNRIDEMGINLDALKENEEFIDLLLQTIPIGIKHHQEEKRHALKNALIHAVQKDALDFATQQIFLNYIDTFTVWHVRILKLFNNPRDWFLNNSKSLPEIGMGSVRDVLQSAFPELRGKNEFVNVIWTDLYNKELVSSDKSIIVTSMTSSGALGNRTTQLGNKFVAFITDDNT